MEFAQYLGAASLAVEAGLEPVEELEEGLVRCFVFLPDRAAVTFHAAFFIDEVNGGVFLDEIDQFQAKLNFL